MQTCAHIYDKNRTVDLMLRPSSKSGLAGPSLFCFFFLFPKMSKFSLFFFSFSFCWFSVQLLCLMHERKHWSLPLLLLRSTSNIGNRRRSSLLWNIPSSGTFLAQAAVWFTQQGRRLPSEDTLKTRRWKRTRTRWSRRTRWEQLRVCLDFISKPFGRNAHFSKRK